MDTTRLTQKFDGSKAELRVVSRQLRDLHDSGQLEADRGHELTIEELIGHLHDAPANSTLIERWNWWMGALDIAYGEYEQFSVRFVDEQPGLNT